MNDIQSLFALQTKNRWNVSSTTAAVRIAKLKRLKQEVLLRREDIKEALWKDFKKPYAESELTEIHTVLDEINVAVKNLKCWMKPKKVRTPLTLFGARSEIHYEAKGVVLILAPWNYPFSLLLNPLIAAVAAGNCSMARPSEKTPYTGQILSEILNAVFPPEEVSVVIGEIDLAEKLLELPFDHIFFTGSTAVGKKIMAAAAKNLTSVTLELGGKSPVIIDSDVELNESVKRIVWGKFVNGGQTCVAPDYVFVPENLKEEFIHLFRQFVFKSYGETELERVRTLDYARLIDNKSFDRIQNKIQNETNLISGEALREENYLPPTLIETSLQSAIMEDEIFGPVLPLIVYKTIDEVVDHIRSKEKPLALYIFTKRKNFAKEILAKTTSGGAVVNNVILHLANPNLPFGGVGHSGTGSYHGYFGYKTFSHEKAVLIQGNMTLVSFFYPPYSLKLNKIAFKFLRFFE